MDGNLIDVVIPCRQSAAQASRAFADQLDSSDGDSQPGGSDGEVKKNKLSRKGPASRLGKPQTYGKRARPPTKASSAVTNSISVSAKLELVSPEAASSPRAPKPKPKQTVKRKRSPLLSIHSLPLMKQVGSSLPVEAENTNLQNAANKELSLRYQISPEPIWKRAKISHHGPSSSLRSDSLSDLTSLSSSTGADSSDSEVEVLDFNPAALAPSEPGGGASTLVASNHGSRQRVEPLRSSQSLGSYVWVLIEPTTARVVDPNKDQGQDEYRMWWPGKILSPRPTEIPLRVKLFGQKNVAIHEPSEGNIVSKLDTLGRWRYQSPIFVSTPHHQTPLSSRKKVGNECDDLERNRCEELEGRWKNAVVEMKRAEDDEQDSDYLPEIGEISSWSGLLHSQGSSKESKGKGRIRKQGKRMQNLDEHGDWESPPPDETLQIPGELVLARENPGRGASVIHNTDHWPAKILAYKAPKYRKEQPKYLVKWLDGTEGEISRSSFYTVVEEGFAICKLGSFESSVVEVENDDEKEDLEAFKARWDFSRRSPSPEAVDPPPSAEEFRQLPIRVRFTYTKPVLAAILNKCYEPVLALHESFIAGGQKRSRLLEYSARRGNMDLVEVSELTNYLKEWCLRTPTMGTSSTNQEDDVECEVKDAVEQDGRREEGGLSGSLKHEIRSLTDLDRGESRSASPAITEAVPSSPGEMPPSSFPVEREERDLSPVVEPVTSTDIVPAGIPDVFGNDDLDRTISRRERPPRQRGCEDYEVLTDLEKLNYCTTILLPESIRQILLWQNGIRTSLELLSPEQEGELYEKGETLLNETEWVFNIKRMRQKAEGIFKRNGTGRRRAQPVDYRE